MLLNAANSHTNRHFDLYEDYLETHTHTHERAVFLKHVITVQEHVHTSKRVPAL